MISTIGTYVTEMIGWVGNVMTDSNIQPFILIASAVGVVGAVVNLGKNIAHVNKH